MQRTVVVGRIGLCTHDVTTQSNVGGVTAGQVRQNSSSYNNNNSNNNNNKSIYIAPWLQVTLFKGACKKKKIVNMLKVKI